MNINISNNFSSEFITKINGGYEVDTVGIINTVCKFKNDNLYFGGIQLLIKIILIFLIIMILSRILGNLFTIEKRYFGMDKKGLYFNYENMLNDCSFTKEQEKYIFPIMMIFIGDKNKSYINDELKIVLLLYLIYKLIFINCQFFGILPFGIPCI